MIKLVEDMVVTIPNVSCFVYTAKVANVVECRVDKSIWSEIRICWDTKGEECQASPIYDADIRNIAFAPVSSCPEAIPILI